MCCSGNFFGIRILQDSQTITTKVRCCICGILRVRRDLYNKNLALFIAYGHFLVRSKDVMNCGSVIWVLKSKRWLGQTAKHHYNYEHFMFINQLARL